MNCRRVCALITPYLDQQLTGAEMQEMQRHFARCHSCAEEYLALRQVRLLLRSLAPKTAPQALPAALSMRLIEDRSASTLPRFSLTRRPRRLATALAFCCLGVLTVAAPFAPATRDSGSHHQAALAPVTEAPAALFWSPWPTVAISALPGGSGSPDLAATGAPLIGGRHAYSLTQPTSPNTHSVLPAFSNDNTASDPFRAPVTLTAFAK